MTFIDEPHNRARARQAAEAAMDMACHGAVDRTAEAVAAFLHEFAIVAMTRMGQRDANYARQEDPLSSAPVARLMRRVERLDAQVNVLQLGEGDRKFSVFYRTDKSAHTGYGATIDLAALDVLDHTPGDQP